MLRKQAEGDHEVRFSAAHGLCELEDRIVGLAGQAPQPLPKELRHALGDVVLFEKRGPVFFFLDERVKVLDLILHRIVDGAVVEDARVLDGSQHRGFLVWVR